ncbi:unnamed protein product [Didymodactylos carnosus]|uniref:Uncharacterized protein n=1 Tax=Didymodactylos carnosus TaxID=1234261 RepID=A0A815HTW9_9BILA|nr:unnamed protein product [Didymodactylos carnosus]CAF1357050.1 unnamed protein product [Didymodactylos carnosus]CAF3999378.1 unnamed protein product [Didymodactylos carnosus]CAF4231636.1 unnamed protein product [Didymodactylos carnosus]
MPIQLHITDNTLPRSIPNNYHPKIISDLFNLPTSFNNNNKFSTAVPSSLRKNGNNSNDVQPFSAYQITRRQPRKYRQVIRLPDPEPVYRTVHRRMPTPERLVISKTIIQKQNANIIERVQSPKKKRKNNRFNQK